MALAFSCLKASIFSTEGIVKKLSLSFLAFFYSLFASIIKPGHVGKFINIIIISRNVGFWIGFVCNLS